MSHNILSTSEDAGARPAHGRFARVLRRRGSPTFGTNPGIGMSFSSRSFWEQARGAARVSIRATP